MSNSEIARTRTARGVTPILTKTSVCFFILAASFMLPVDVVAAGWFDWLKPIVFILAALAIALTARRCRRRAGRKSRPAPIAGPAAGDLSGQLGRAIRERQFVMHYQLQYDLKTGLPRGAEALIRWNHPQRGLVPPQSFIPLAEAAGCINEISQWALEEASRQKQIWNEQGLPIEKVAVNLSGYSFKLQDLAGIVGRTLTNSNLQSDDIELEITESVLLDDIDGAMDTIQSMKRQGLTFVLDDFGTGYSSLAYLRRLPASVIKIDKSFVCAMPESNADVRIVRAIIELAHDLGLTVVAEGIETRAQLLQLQKFGCDCGQGFLFHKPQPAAQIRPHESGHPAIGRLACHASA